MYNWNSSDILDYENRIDACINTELTHPDNIPLRISKIITDTQQLYIVRDDFICGGTKSRVAFDFIQQKIEEGYSEFVYMSPLHGAAQIALPWILKVLQPRYPDKVLKATVIIPSYPFPYTVIGKTLGLNVIVNKDVESTAREYSSRNNALLLESGFNYSQVVAKISQLAKNIEKHLGTFDEVWSAAGSGTLSRGLQLSGIGNRYFAVCIFGGCPDIGNAFPILHYQDANDSVDPIHIPPFRSAMYYDAKVFQYLKGRLGKILLWNVA